MFSLIKAPYCNTNPPVTIYALLSNFWISVSRVTQASIHQEIRRQKSENIEIKMPEILSEGFKKLSCPYLSNTVREEVI